MQVRSVSVDVATPGPVPTGQVRGPAEAEPLQVGGGEARRVPVVADQDHPGVVVDVGEGGAAGVVQPPLEVDPLDDDRTGELALAADAA